MSTELQVYKQWDGIRENRQNSQYSVPVMCARMRKDLDCRLAARRAQSESSFSFSADFITAWYTGEALSTRGSFTRSELFPKDKENRDEIRLLKASITILTEIEFWLRRDFCVDVHLSISGSVTWKCWPLLCVFYRGIQISILTNKVHFLGTLFIKLAMKKMYSWNCL